MNDLTGSPSQPRNPLHGVTLEAMVRALEAHFGWAELALRIELFDDEIESLQLFDPLTGRIRQKIPRFAVYPSSHYVTPREVVLRAVETIKEELRELTKTRMTEGDDRFKDVQINILEIRRPELDANIVGDTIARQIENRINYKRAIKMAIASTLRMGAEGIKIKISGRVGGAEIARTEEIKQGRVPLHTYRMDIDYASVFALTVYGKIGIKVWICKGEVLAKRDLNPNFIGTKAEGGEHRGERRSDDRRDRGGRDDRRGGGRGGDRRDRRG